MSTAILDFFPEMTANATDDEKSPSSESSTYNAQIKYWCSAAYEEAKKISDETPEIAAMADTLDYLSGMQWKGAQPGHKAKPVTNRMLRLFWETVGMLTDIRPIFEVHATSQDDSFSKPQEILNLIARAWALENNFDMRLAFVVMYGMLTTGYAKLEWDPFAAGGQGDISMSAVSPNSLLRLGSGDDDDLQQDECVIYRKVRTLNWIKRKFPITGHAVRPDITYSQYDAAVNSPAHISPKLFMNLSPGMKRKIGTSPEIQHSVFPKAEYREYWMKDSSMNATNREILMGRAGTNWCYKVKPGQPLYPRGRIIAMANQVILDDQPNPYWHSRHPFAMLRLNAVPWQALGMNPMKSWMSMQDINNQIMAGVLNMVKLALNPPLMAPKNAFSPEAWAKLDTSRPNEKAQYSANAPHKPEWRPAPQVPGYVMQVNALVSQEMDQSSGVSGMNDALKKKQVPSGDSLDQIQQARNTPVRLMGRNIEGFIGDLGILFVPSALQFYTASRRVDLLGSQGLLPVDYDSSPGTLVPAGMEPESYARKFKFKIERGSLLSVQRVERINFALKLRAMRDMSRHNLFRILDINIDVNKNDQELLEEAKQMASIAPPKQAGGKHK